ncbi:MAG: hypothetical protein ABI543_10855 [Ignavibacteria bacterium]
MPKKIDSEFSKLPNLSLVFGYIAVKELPKQEQIIILNRLGYGNSEIATICGVSSHVVAVIKNIRKNKAKKK